MKRRLPLALVIAIALVTFAARALRGADRTHDARASSEHDADATPPADVTPPADATAPTASPSGEARTDPAGGSVRDAPTRAAGAEAFAPRRRALRKPGAGTVLVAIGLLVALGIPTTWATMTDQTVMAPVSVTAGTVNAPTAVTATQTATAARIGWTAPTGGITPDGYKVYRSTTSGSYGAALASPTTSPYDDITAAECTDYYYTAAASRANLVSAQATPEASVMIDRTAPTLGTNGAHIYFDPSPRPKVADYVRVTPGGNVEVYAQVNDNCAAANTLTVNFNFGAPFNTSNAATFGNYQPVAGGPTYNYMWGPYALPANSLANGQVMTWTVTATDPTGNSATLGATSLTGDGVGPTFSGGKVVSAVTNYYDVTKNVGEILSNTSTQTALKNQGYWVYANASDTADVSGIAANASTITTTATNVALPESTYSTDNGVSWAFRNATALVPNVNIAEGGTPNVVLTATDGLGNTSTLNVNPKINITAITTATCANTGNASNTLNSGDVTTWTLGNATTGPTIDPASLKPSWTTAPFTFTGTVTFTNNATTDYMDLNTALGMTMLAGTNQTSSWTLGNTNWVGAAGATIPNSVISVPTFNTVRLAYGNPSVAVTDRNANARAYIGTNVKTASGLPVASTITSSTCSSSAW